jgi:hypothetical protein
MNKVLKIRALDGSGQWADVKVETTSENILLQNTHYWAGGCYDVWDSSLDEPSDNISVTSQDSREGRGTRPLTP